MSKKLAALVLALGILACSMGVKQVLSSDHSGKPVLSANGPAPVPPPDKKSGG